MNRLETSAKRLKVDARFEKRPEGPIEGAGWFIRSIDGVSKDVWLGPTISQAVVAFEQQYDKLAYA